MVKSLKWMMMCGLVMALVAGCAGMGKKSDEELIGETMAQFKAALEAKNIDQIMTCVSEKFDHPEVGGKEEAKEMLQMGLDSGYADEGEVSLENMQITKNDDGTASVYPVEASSVQGSISVEVVLVKEGDKWLVSTINPDGM